MSLDHTIKMLETLKQYKSSEINMVLDGSDGVPLLSISYNDGCYELKSLYTSIVETCDDIESAITLIERLMNVTLYK